MALPYGFGGQQLCLVQPAWVICTHGHLGRDLDSSDMTDSITAVGPAEMASLPGTPHPKDSSSVLERANGSTQQKQPAASGPS
ncbi:hypothetical protein PG984_002813 [Apiospora sp. TS-2023a]